jgi:hypothetical protein
LILESGKSQTCSGLVLPRHIYQQVKQERFSAFFGIFLSPLKSYSQLDLLGHNGLTVPR